VEFPRFQLPALQAKTAPESWLGYLPARALRVQVGMAISTAARVASSLPNAGESTVLEDRQLGKEIELADTLPASRRTASPLRYFRYQPKAAASDPLMSA
jgi:hypothetical protein